LDDVEHLAGVFDTDERRSFVQRWNPGGQKLLVDDLGKPSAGIGGAFQQPALR